MFVIVFEPYFRATADPSLADFVNQHKHTIATYHRIGDDVPKVWTKRYAKALSHFYREAAIDRQPAITSKDVDWAHVALLVIKVGRRMHSVKIK